jgi:RHH-type rel operon transcriptional repressor/antitoxin RelB
MKNHLLYMTNGGTIMLALRLPEEIEIRLDALAKATGRTKSYYAREAILTHLEDMEDAYLAERAYLKFKAIGDKAVSLYGNSAISAHTKKARLQIPM